MPIYYVEDYEALTGKKPAQDVELAAAGTEAKVVAPADEKPAPKKTSAAQTKAKKK